MARRKQRDPRKELFWRKQLRAQQASGLSVRDFCHAQRLAESGFHYWRREILKRDHEAAAGKPAFVSVAVETAVESRIEVVLVGGTIVRVHAGFDDQTLRRLLALLQEPTC